MATRKYIVRDGFVVHLLLGRADGSTYTRTHEAGEELQLDDNIYAKHAHKLDYASEKDRAAALAAERAAAVAERARQDPGELIRQLTDALAQARAAQSTAQPAQPLA